LSTPSIGPRYGFPLLKIIISRNIYRMGTLIVKLHIYVSMQKCCDILTSFLEKLKSEIVLIHVKRAQKFSF
jgi:hypothetical protein